MSLRDKLMGYAANSAQQAVSTFTYYKNTQKEATPPYAVVLAVYPESQTALVRYADQTLGNVNLGGTTPISVNSIVVVLAGKIV